MMNSTISASHVNHLQVLLECELEDEVKDDTTVVHVT